MVVADPGRCHVCPPLPGAAAGSVGSARWRAALRDSASKAWRAWPGYLPRTPFPTCLGRGPRVGRDSGTHCVFPFQIFLPSQWRRGRGEEEKRERAGTRRLIGPSLTPPLPGAQIVLEAWAPRPSARMLGRWEGLNGAPSPCGSSRRMSGSD